MWLTVGVVSLALVLALPTVNRGCSTWWALREDLRAAQTRIERMRSDVVELEREGGALTASGEPFALDARDPRAARLRARWRDRSYASI
jgi:hypothetical protein